MKFKVTLSVAALMSTLAGGVFAQSFPEGPITWVVNWPAGGGQDITSRLVAERLSSVLGVAVVIENYDGAGGLTGMRELAAADADGYTIGMLGSSTVIQQYTSDGPVMMNQLEVLSFFGPDPGALTVGADTPYATLEDYVSAIKDAPGEVPNGNDPPGGASYISAAIMESALDLQLNKVPYAGYTPTVTALLGGEVVSATVPLPQVLEHAESGDVRILGVMAGSRHFLAPDVPTFAEQGYNVFAGDFRAIVAPAGLPEGVSQTLSEALIEVLSADEFITVANIAGYMIEPLGAEEASARIMAFDKQVYPVLEEAGLVTNPR